MSYELKSVGLICATGLHRIVNKLKVNVNEDGSVEWPSTVTFKNRCYDFLKFTTVSDRAIYKERVIELDTKPTYEELEKRVAELEDGSRNPR